MSYFSEVLADSPLAYWRLGETSGASAADSSGNARTTTWAGTYTRGAASLLTTDTGDAAVSVNGAGYADTPSLDAAYSAAFNVANLTVEAVVKPSAIGTYMLILDRDNGGGGGGRMFQFRITDVGTLQLIWWTTGGAGPFFATGATTLVAGTTYHLAATVDGTAGRVYVNGVLDATTVQSGSMLASSGNLGLRIGASTDYLGPIFLFKGVIDEVAYYGTALSAARVSAHHAAGLLYPSLLSDKVLWLRAKDQAGADGSAITTWTDQSGMAHSPTSFSATTVKAAGTPSGGKSVLLSNAAISLPNLDMVDRSFTGPTATVSSQYNPGYTPESLVDGGLSEFGWASQGAPSVGTPQWARLQSPAPVVVTSFQIRGKQSAGVGRYPKDFTFQGSSDGTSFTTLSTHTGVTWTQDYELKSFTVPGNATAYLYHRIYITATQGNDLVHLDEITLNNVQNPGGPTAGELWVVMKSNTTFGAAWRFGTSNQQCHYTYQGEVYSDFGNGTRRNYTPTLPLTSWRILCSKIDWNAIWSDSIDMAQQSSAQTAVRSWLTTPKLAEGWTGEIAEVLMRRTVSSPTERAGIVAYLNAEHGLTVVAPTSVTATRSTLWGVAGGVQPVTTSRVVLWTTNSNRFDPSTLSGKVLWLRAKDNGANGSSVATWVDQSGAAHNAVAATTTPLVATASTPNSGKSIRFTGQRMNLPDLGLTQSRLTATASTVYPGTLAQDAVDNNISNFWVAGTNATVSVPQWLRVQPSVSTVATSYQITARLNSYGNAPRDWIFQGSTDGSAWTDLDTRTGQTFANQTPQSYSFSNAVAYAYYRILVSATTSAIGPDIAELTLNSVANAVTHSPGEMWVVVNTDGGSGPQSWKYGNDPSASHYTYGGAVYDDWGNNTRRSFTPTMTVIGTWRLLRIGITDTGGGAGVWFADIDNVSQASVTGVTRSHRTVPMLTDTFQGNIAEVLIRSQISTSGEVANLITYFNSEHGLAISAPVTASRSTTWNVAPTSALLFVVEVVSGAAASLASPQSISIASTPVTGDVAFVILSSRGSRAITAVSGLGASWANFYSNADATNGSQSIWVGKNVTSAGSMSVTISGTTDSGQLAALLVRGLPNPAAVQGSTTAVSTGTTSNTVTANNTELVLGAIYIRPGPLSGFTGTPAGWVAQGVTNVPGTAYFQTAYFIPTSTGSASYSFTATGTFRTASIVRAYSAAQVTASRSTSWLLRGRITATAATTWAVIGRPTASALTRWAVLRALTAPATRTTSWLTDSDIARPPASVMEWYGQSVLAPAAGVNIDFTFTTAPLPGDFIVVIVGHDLATVTGPTTIAGLGDTTFTLTKARVFASNQRFSLYVGVGASAAGLLRVNVSGSGTNVGSRVVAMLVRGIPDFTFYYEQASFWNGNDMLGAGNSYNYTGPAGPDTLMLGITLPNSGTDPSFFTFPSAATSPGFTADVGNMPTYGWMGVSWQAFDTATTPNAMTLGVTANNNFSYHPLVVYWIGGPPGVRGIDTFEETLTQQDLTDARLDGVGSDVAVIGTSLFSSDSDYIEVATKTQNVLVATSAYTETPTMNTNAAMWAQSAVVEAPTMNLLSQLRMGSYTPDVLTQTPASLRAGAAYVEVLVAGKPDVIPEPEVKIGMHGWGLVVPGIVVED